MLTNEQKSQNKVRYLTLLTKLGIDITAFTEYLTRDRVNYFEKPYSSHVDSSYAGSLCERALQLYDELTKLCETYFPGKYKETTIIKVALLKDIYRAELFEVSKKSVKNGANWEEIDYVKTKEDAYRPIFGDVNFSSYMIARKFITFATDEDEIIEAINFGGLGNNNAMDIHAIRKDYPLVTLITMAEMALTYFKANKEENN